MMKKNFSHLDCIFKGYLALHTQAWVKLKMSNITTEQNDLDYLEFCTKLEEVYKKHGYNFYRKIDEEVLGNSWLPLFRKHAKSIISLEDISSEIFKPKNGS